LEKFDKEISVIFPAYNEEENIEVCVLIAYHILKELVKDFEIVIINDGSIDKTGQICLGLEKNLPKVRIINKEKNEGYGYALRDGFKRARFDLVFFSDADRQFDIINLRDLLKYIDDYDIVVGFRKNRQDSFKRKFLSWGYNVLVRLLFGIEVHDIDCAFKLFNKRIFNKIKVESQHYFVNTEILAKARLFGFTIKEVGVTHFPRVDGISKVGFIHIPHTLKEMKRIRTSIEAVKKGCA